MKERTFTLLRPFNDFMKREKIEILEMQKLTAMKPGQLKDDPAVAEEAQKRLDKLGAKPEEILSVLRQIKPMYGKQYVSVINAEIKKYESIKA